MRKGISLLLAGALCASCASTGPNTKKGGAIGAGAGAVVGGLIGHATGSTARGAIIGAAVGGTAGALIVLGHGEDEIAVLDEAGVRAIRAGLAAIEVDRPATEGHRRGGAALRAHDAGRA